MEKVIASLVASCQLAACATTGGKISLAATAGSVVGFASTFKFAVFCSSELSPCPENTAASVFALTALAAAITGITFEVVNLALPNDEPTKPKPIASPVPTTLAAAAPDPSPSALGFTDAFAIAYGLATERGFHVEPSYLTSRFDDHSRYWVFEWRAPTSMTVVVVTERGVVTGRECSEAEPDPCDANRVIDNR